MPIDHKIFPDKKVVFAKGSGWVDVTDKIQHLESLAADPDYVPPMRKVIDFRDIEGLNFSPNDADAIARKKAALAQKFKGEKCAFVASSDLTYGNLRMLQAHVSDADFDTAVFRSLPDALNWLGVPTDLPLK